MNKTDVEYPFSSIYNFANNYQHIYDTFFYKEPDENDASSYFVKIFEDEKKIVLPNPEKGYQDETYYFEEELRWHLSKVLNEMRWIVWEEKFTSGDLATWSWRQQTLTQKLDKAINYVTKHEELQKYLFVAEGLNQLYDDIGEINPIVEKATLQIVENPAAQKGIQLKEIPRNWNAYERLHNGLNRHGMMLSIFPIFKNQLQGIDVEEKIVWGGSLYELKYFMEGFYSKGVLLEREFLDGATFAFTHKKYGELTKSQINGSKKSKQSRTVLIDKLLDELSSTIDKKIERIE